MSIKFKFYGGKDLNTKIKKLPLTTKKKIFNALAKDGNNMRNHIIKNMQQTQRADWFYIRTKSKKRHYPSAPYQFPAIDSGELIRSIVVDKQPFKFIIVGVNLGAKYAEKLEDGTRFMKPRPFMKPTFKTFYPKIKETIEKTILSNI